MMDDMLLVTDGILTKISTSMKVVWVPLYSTFPSRYAGYISRKSLPN